MSSTVTALGSILLHLVCRILLHTLSDARSPDADEGSYYSDAKRRSKALPPVHLKALIAQIKQGLRCLSRILMYACPHAILAGSRRGLLITFVLRGSRAFAKCLFADEPDVAGGNAI